MSELKSRPYFIVEVNNGAKVFRFGCTIHNAREPHMETELKTRFMEDKSYTMVDDMFIIDEVCICRFDLNQEKPDLTTIYRIAGPLLGQQLYFLMLNFLRKRGIDELFATTLSEYATYYEQTQYVAFLKKLLSIFS